MSRTFKVFFKKSAIKELRALPSSVQNRIIDVVQLLSLNPYTEILPIKKLKGADALYRIRVQDYRVLYAIDKEAVTIVIIKIGHRKDVYS